MELIPKIILNTIEEILIILSNSSTFKIFEREINITDLLRDQIKNGINIRLLIHGNRSKYYQSDEKGNSFFKLAQEYPNRFKLQWIESKIYNRLNIVIADEELLLTMESKNIIENTDKERFLKMKMKYFKPLD